MCAILPPTTVEPSYNTNGMPHGHGSLPLVEQQLHAVPTIGIAPA